MLVSSDRFYFFSNFSSFSFFILLRSAFLVDFGERWIGLSCGTRAVLWMDFKWTVGPEKQSGCQPDADNSIS